MTRRDGSPRQGQGRAASVRAALSGLAWVLANERNGPMHAAHAITVALLWAALGLPAHVAVAGLVAGAIALGAECMNTALERAVDLACPREDPTARLSKDAASAAVLCSVAALAAVDLAVVVPAVGAVSCG